MSVVFSNAAVFEGVEDARAVEGREDLPLPRYQRRRRRSKEDRGLADDSDLTGGPRRNRMVVSCRPMQEAKEGIDWSIRWVQFVE
jgi:hypothetical protein